MVTLFIIVTMVTMVTYHGYYGNLPRSNTHHCRLVRQSACLSLARLKSPSSVPHLLLVWRNDFIR